PFALFAAPAPSGLRNTLTITSAAGYTLATKDVTIVPGQTADVGSCDAGVGDLEVSLTYNGAAPSASGAVGQLVARIIAPAQSLGPVTDHATFTDIGPGSYTLFISGVLLQSETAVQVGGGGVFVNDPLQDAVTIAAGRKTTHSFELAPAVGIVKGTATINGDQPTAGPKICVKTVSRSNVCDLLQKHSCAELAPPPELCTTTSEGTPAWSRPA